MLKDLFEDISKELLDEINEEIDLEYKTLNKHIKKTYNEKKNDIGIVKIDLIKILDKKSIGEMESIYELNPILSYILEENLYNKNISYSKDVLDMCKGFDTSKNLICIGTSVLVSGLKTLIKSCKIQKKIYFKNDFLTPIEYMIYEYNKINVI